MNLDEAAKAFREFVAVVQALRTPGTGCPWDLEQTHQTLAPYLVEETYEVLDTIDRKDDPSLSEELGDLLLQVVLHAQLAADRGVFEIGEVVEGITRKMVRRHPHVFADARVSGTADVLRNWEQIKAAEAQAKGTSAYGAGVDAVPLAMPALLRAQRLIARAAKQSGETRASGTSFREVQEKLAALERVVGPGAPQATGKDAPHGRLEERLGELLFALCHLARQLGVNAEGSLRVWNARFVEQHDGPATPHPAPGESR